jgi:hypothetical protein
MIHLPMQGWRWASAMCKRKQAVPPISFFLLVGYSHEHRDSLGPRETAICLQGEIETRIGYYKKVVVVLSCTENSLHDDFLWRSSQFNTLRGQNLWDDLFDCGVTGEEWTFHFLNPLIFLPACFARERVVR